MKHKISVLILIFNTQLNGTIAWQNWAENQVCFPKAIQEPKNLDELKTIINDAKKNKWQVRAVGTGHSWTDILCADGVMILTNKLNKVLAIDQEKKQIRVQAGIKLKELIEVLAAHNLALPNQPAITEQSIAGVISTATHGSGKTGTMAAFITKIELVTADGELRELSETHQPDYFAAARVSVGSLGILYAVTIQCVPLFKVKHEQFKTTWNDMKKQYEKLNHDNDFFSFLYQVQEDFVAVDIWNKVGEQQKAGKSRYKKRMRNNGELSQLDSAVDGYKALSGPPSPFYLEEEIAIEQSLLPQAVKGVKELILSYKPKGILIYGILCRFVQADPISYLSPAKDKNVVFLSVTMPYKEENQFYRDYYELMLKFNGRPHWGKINYLNFADTKKIYGSSFEAFLEVRKKLDPSGMFSNAFTKRVFGW